MEEPRIRAERRRRLQRWIVALLVASIAPSGQAARAAAASSSIPPSPAAPVSAPSSVAAAGVRAPGAIPRQILVRFARGTRADARARVHRALGATVLRAIPVLGVQVLRVPSVAAALRVSRTHPDVAFAERNVTGSIALSPSDACHEQPCDGIPGQWHHLMTNTPFGWDAAPDAEPVTIAVLDTKIDPAHPDWVNTDGSSQLLPGLDLVPASRHEGAARYHGTFVAGLAAAATGNGIDAAGAAFRARVLPITVVDGGGTTDAATLAEAIIAAWRAGARVINLSLGLTGPSQTVRDAIRTATATATGRPAALVVAAAGNNTGDAAFYPGSYPEVMSVSGTDARDRRAACSNHNANVSVAAPADRLIGLQHLPGRLVQAPCGTSAAAPQVSALAALLFMQDPSRSPADVRRLIEDTADDLGPAGRDNDTGHGRINIARALSADTERPHASRATATVVPARGGATTIGARVGAGATRAQVFIGSPSAAPVPMRIEGGRATVDAPVRLPAGAHPIWVRSGDEYGWGPTTVGVLGVDGAGPVFWGTSAQDAVRAAGRPMRISFAIGDDYATTFTHAIEIRSSVTNALVHREVRSATAGGAHVYTWEPPLTTAAGHYRVLLGAVDEVGNVATKELGALVT